MTITSCHQAVTTVGLTLYLCCFAIILTIAYRCEIFVGMSCVIVFIIYSAPPPPSSVKIFLPFLLSHCSDIFDAMFATKVNAGEVVIQQGKHDDTN